MCQKNMEFRVKRPRTTQHKHTARCFSRDLFGWNSQSKILTSGIYYRYLISSTKSFQFVKSSNENTPTRSSQENTPGEAAHHEHTTFTYIAVKSLPFANLFPCAYLAKTVNHRSFFCQNLWSSFPMSSRLKATTEDPNSFQQKESLKPISQDENS